ncbi:MAG: hypothetical protein J7K61_03175 [Thermoplasmata archaeon]|nr:hypothetical protein [Thermoplasmata archaeon]
MKKYVMAAGLVAVVAVAAIASSGAGIAGWTTSHDGNEGNARHGWKGKLNEMMERNRIMRKMMERNNMMKAGRHIMRNLLNLDRIEGNLSYIDGTYYVDDTPVYFGDEWFLEHVIRSDYDGDGDYETIADEINGLMGNDVVINGMYGNGTLIASHINGMWLRVPVMAEFVELNGVIEKINGTYYIDGYRIVLPNKQARSDYDGDGLLERMRMEIDGLVGENVNIDGYTHNGNLRPLHINGIAI